MPTVRAIRPTDFVPLIAFFRDGSLREVTAQLWPELQGERGTRVMKELFRRLIVQPGGYAQAWVCYEGGAVRGLAVARPRAGKLAWDVRDLLVPPEEHTVGVDLLEQVSAEAAKRGARRVFLSTGSDGDVTRLARQAGFAQFTSEALYAVKLPTAVAPNG